MIPETPSAIRETMAELAFRPRRRHGQNFLADPNIRDAIVRDAGAGPGDLVLEVGPGLGTLTKGLIESGAAVVAVERDRILAEFLAEAFEGEDRLTLVTGDAMHRKALAPAAAEALAVRRPAASRFLFVSNLPYAVSTPLLAALYREGPLPDRAVVMVQKEVADRLAGAVGTADYGPLAVLLALRASVRVLREVGGQVFVPRPPVRSAVVLVTTRAREVPGAMEGVRLARAAFLHRRKSIRKALSQSGYDRGAVEAALSRAGIDARARPETIPPAAWVDLAGLLPEADVGKRLDDSADTA